MESAASTVRSRHAPRDEPAAPQNPILEGALATFGHHAERDGYVQARLAGKRDTSRYRATLDP